MPEELKAKKILVTGGAGFIGSNLVDMLSPQNKVTVLDNLSSGRLSNLAKSEGRIRFVKGDILDRPLVNEAMKGIDYVFHLAANVGNMRSIEDPLYDMGVNIEGTINILEAAVKAKITRLVYSASGAVFGEARYMPIDEEHPVNPESPYGVSKLAAEKYVFAFRKVHGLPVTAVRYFNVYGPRQGTSGYANVLAVFFGRIQRNEPLTVFGDGEQSRDFVYVGDVARANMLAAVNPEAVGQIFNIATGKSATVNELVQVINDVSGRKNQVVYADSRPGEVKHSKANIAKAQKVLGYAPKTSLAEGVKLTWEAEVGAL